MLFAIWTFLSHSLVSVSKQFNTRSSSQSLIHMDTSMGLIYSTYNQVSKLGHFVHIPLSLANIPLLEQYARG